MQRCIGTEWKLWAILYIVGKKVEFNIYKSSARKWFMSTVPDHLEPGSDGAIVFYYQIQYMPQIYS